MKKILFFIPFFLLLFLANCARVVTPNANPQNDYEQKEVLMDNVDVVPPDIPVLEQFFTTNAPYNWISYRGRMNITLKNRNYGFQIFYVNRIDSIIYLNINISGIELARLTATPKEVVFVNKMSKEYYKGDYKFLTSMFDFPINFDMVQSLLNGVDFKGFTSNFTLTAQETDLQWIDNKRCHTQSGFCFHQHLVFNNSLQLQRNYFEIEHPKRAFIIEYRNYTEEKFPFFQHLSIEIPHISLKASGELRNLQFNISGTTNIKIPEGFTPINP